MEFNNRDSNRMKLLAKQLQLIEKGNFGSSLFGPMNALCALEFRKTVATIPQ